MFFMLLPPSLVGFSGFASGFRRAWVLIWHQPCSSHAGAGLGVAMALISQRHPAS
jgi:hypothetical protein